MQIKLYHTLFFPSLANHKWNFFNLFRQWLLYLFNLNPWQITVSFHPWLTADFSLFTIPCTIGHLLCEQCTLILRHVTLTLGSNFANEWQKTNGVWKALLDKVIKWVLQESIPHVPCYTNIESYSTLIPHRSITIGF